MSALATNDIDSIPRSAVGDPEVVDGRPMTRRLAISLLVAIVGLFVVIWALTDSLDNVSGVDVPRIEVPAVKALSLQDARRQLESDGFAVSVLFQPNETEAKGTIIGQRPLAGAKVEQGGLITILASDGKLGMLVPSVEGQQVQDATASLQSVGLVVEVVPTPDETVRQGDILSTEPAAGGRVVPGTPVKLFVSAGPAPRQVPAVVGKTVEQALAEIGRNDLGVGDVRKVVKAGVAAGTVIDLSPGAGSMEPRDTPINLTVAAEPPTTPAPYLVGLLASSAQQVAKAASFTLNITQTAVPAGDPLAGRVISQGTAPTRPLPNGAAIDVTVGVASAAPPSAPAATPSTVSGG